MAAPVWMVTGASKGMGRAFVEEALRTGHRVVATSRNPEKLAAEIAADADQFLAVNVALAEEASARAGVEQAVQRFGTIDVLVNNAGYSLLGAVEEISDAEARANFDVNVFGLLTMTRAVLPVMRAQRSGTVLNMASISASVTGPATGLYSATKAAVLMFSEALADELEAFGVRVTAICPGGVRTDFLDPSSSRHPEHPIDDYALVRRVLKGYSRLNHNQGGSPELVARALLRLVELPELPRRLYLGSDAVGAIQQKAETTMAEVARNFELSVSTDG